VHNDIICRDNITPGGTPSLVGSAGTHDVPRVEFPEMSTKVLGTTRPDGDEDLDEQRPSPPSTPSDNDGSPDSETGSISLAPDMELGDDGKPIVKVKRKRTESSATESSPPKTGSSCTYH
jgi:hypothetical protein